MNLDERKVLLREGLQADAAESLALLGRAVAGADEAERKALARVLPPSRLHKQEGSTPRAGLVLGALGSPKLITDQIAHPRPDRDASLRDPEAGPFWDAVHDGVADRDRDWAVDFIHHLTDWGAGEPTRGYRLARRLRVAHDIAEVREPYVDSMLHALAEPVGRGGSLITALHDAFAADPQLREEWALLFATEGAGANYYLTTLWIDLIDRFVTEASAADPTFRTLMLDGSLGALLRDWSLKNISWYVHVHRLLDPTPAEIRARESSYVAVLGTAPSTGVTLAQDLLARALADDGPDGGLTDPEALIAASAGVLGRSEKKLRKTQLGLLATLAPAHDVTAVVGEALPHLPPDLARLAVPLAGGAAAPAEEAESARPPVTIPAPRTTPLPPLPSRPARTDEREVADTIGELFEDVGSGADIGPLLTWFGAHSPTADHGALAQRARTVFEATYDAFRLSPRRHLAAVVLAWLGEKSPDVGFRGYGTYRTLAAGEQPPAAMEVEEHTWTSEQVTSEGTTTITGSGTMRGGYVYAPAHSPEALFALTMMAARNTLRLRRAPSVPEPVAPRTPGSVAWERTLCRPTPGRFISEQVRPEVQRPVWMHTAAPSSGDPVADQLRDASKIAGEHTFRVLAAREQDGYARLVEWAADLLRDDVDTLAAHFHPMIWAASEVINVRGVPELLAALGAAHHPPGAPTYSALALAASAKEAPHRAAAAEAIAALAESGLLDPEAFAAELTAHLGDRLVMAPRVAATFDDAASISPIAGYRVLQTATGLLPALAGVTGAGKIAELLARLAPAYGERVPVPEALRPKLKGSSALALALRTLDAGAAHGTDLADAAAAQAAAAREAR